MISVKFIALNMHRVVVDNLNVTIDRNTSNCTDSGDKSLHCCDNFTFDKWPCDKKKKKSSEVLLNKKKKILFVTVIHLFYFFFPI